MNKKDVAFMRRIVRIPVWCCAIALLLSCLFLTNSCAPGAARVELRATVLQCTGSTLLVEPAEGSPELRPSDQFSVPAAEARLFDEQGNRIQAEDFQVGDQIRVLYDGVIYETYPARLAKCDEIHRVASGGSTEP